MNDTTLLALRALINEHHVSVLQARNLQRDIEAAYDSGDPLKIHAVRVDLVHRWRYACSERDRLEAAILRHCTDIIETHQRGVASDAGSESEPVRALEWPVDTRARGEHQTHTLPVSPV